MRSSSLVSVLYFVLLSGCGFPYIGARQITPDDRIAVTDSEGKELKDFDLYVYRCTHPGSQFDRVFSFPAQTQSAIHVQQQSEAGIKMSGYTWLAPDFAVSNEPEPYWVACVNKAGFQSRRWSLNEEQGNPIAIRLSPGSEPGPDFCSVAINSCNPCRSYEYFFYTNSRYRHSACQP